MDEGWTRWLLERYLVQFDTLHDADVRNGDLSVYHAIVLPDQDGPEILNGHAPGTMPERYTGGVGVEGAANLKRFVEAGGTLIALDHASDFAIEQLGIPVRNVLKDVPPEDFFIPGSLVRVRVDNGDPLAFGMQEEAAVQFVRSQAFSVVPAASEGERRGSRDVDVVARYADEGLLLSGWELGADRHLAGRAAMVRAPLGQGNVVLIGFRSQFRGQPSGTFKLLFDSILASTMTELPGESRGVVFDGR
jgi:hypothetical protein